MEPEKKKPAKDQKTKPPVQPAPTPPPPPEKKKGADPNDDGGAQKGLPKKKKACAHGRLAKLDLEGERLEVITPDETLSLRLTDKTEVRVGTAPGSLTDLAEGDGLTVYCDPGGPQDVATLIQIDRHK